MSVYAGIAASALALIKSKGSLVTLTRKVVSVDPVTQATTSASTTHDIYAVGLPAGDGATVHVGSLESRNIIELHMALAGVAIDPAPGDLVAWAGADWRVLKVPMLLRPDGGSAIYAKAYLER